MILRCDVLTSALIHDCRTILTSLVGCRKYQTVCHSCHKQTVSRTEYNNVPVTTKVSRRSVVFVLCSTAISDLSSEMILSSRVSL